MVSIDLSGIATFIPVFGFMLVFSVTFALLGKTKLFEGNKLLNILISFSIAIIFLVSANAIEYVRVITPWFAAFVVSLLFIALVVGLFTKEIDKFFPAWFGWIIVIVLIVIFVASASYVFGDLISKYLQGPKEFLLQPTILGVIILLIVSVFTGWLLTKKDK